MSNDNKTADKVTTSPQQPTAATPTAKHPTTPRNEFYRAATEDDDGYDPYSDRPAQREPLFEPDPWR